MLCSYQLCTEQVERDVLVYRQAPEPAGELADHQPSGDAGGLDSAFGCAGTGIRTIGGEQRAGIIGVTRGLVAGQYPDDLGTHPAINEQVNLIFDRFPYQPARCDAGRIRHGDLVERLLADLQARADGGEIQPRSVARYRSALGHYLAFADHGGDISSKFPFAAGVNRDFALQFAAFLKNRMVSSNGSDASPSRPMRGAAIVWDAVRAMFEWAIDPDRGKALPLEFRNPFRKAALAHRPIKDPFGEPDITVDMCRALLEACDDYQLRLFAPMVLYGLRAAEPVYLFGEYIEAQWFKVPCASEIGYVTKGKRDKRLPLLEPLTSILGPKRSGLLYVRRDVANGLRKPPLLGASLTEIAAEIQCRAQKAGAISAIQHQKIRDEVLAAAGAISYDRIEGEFGVLARALKWPQAATLKDLRHSFASVLAGVGMPEVYRQYLMGHSPSSAAINVYTHLNQLGEWYTNALAGPWAGIIELLGRRSSGNR